MDGLLHLELHFECLCPMLCLDVELVPIQNPEFGPSGCLYFPHSQRRWLVHVVVRPGSRDFSLRLGCGYCWRIGRPSCFCMISSCLSRRIAYCPCEEIATTSETAGRSVCGIGGCSAMGWKKRRSRQGACLRCQGAFGHWWTFECLLSRSPCSNFGSRRSQRCCTHRILPI